VFEKIWKEMSPFIFEQLEPAVCRFSVIEIMWSHGNILTEESSLKKDQHRKG
jgi:hypothetical protein